MVIIYFNIIISIRSKYEKGRFIMRDFGRITSPVNKKYAIKKNKSNRMIKFLLSIVILGLLIIFGINFLGYNSEQVIITSQQKVKDSIQVSAVLIRSERLTLAPQDGKIDLYYAEGDRVSSGNRIATISNRVEIDNLYNYHAGIISYNIDGLETTLRMDNLNDLTYNKLVNLKGKINPIDSGDKVNLGRPVFKIIDNFQFYLAVFLPQDQLLNYESGNKIEVIFPGLDESFPGKIEQIIGDKPQNIMVIAIDKFIPQLISIRNTKVEIVRKKYHGILLPKKALIQSPDKVEVRVKGYTKNYLKEVKILGELEDQVVVKGLEPGLKIMLN